MSQKTLPVSSKFEPILFCFENHSELLNVLVIKNFVFNRTISWNSERSEQFLKQNTFLTCYWRFQQAKGNGEAEGTHKGHSWDFESRGANYSILPFSLF